MSSTASLQTFVNRLSRAELESVVFCLAEKYPFETELIVQIHLPAHKRLHSTLPVDIPHSHLRSEKMGLWAKVPWEIMTMIINSDNLSLSDLLTIATSVCKGWRSLKNQSFLWESIDTDISSYAKGPHWLSYAGHVKLLGDFIPANSIRRITLTGVDPFTPAQIIALFVLLGERSHPIQSISLKGKKITHRVLEGIVKLGTINLDILQSLTVEHTHERSITAQHLVRFLQNCPHLTRLETSIRFDFTALKVLSKALVRHDGGNNYLAHLSLKETYSGILNADDLLGLGRLFPELQVIHLGALGTNNWAGQSTSPTSVQLGHLHTLRIDSIKHVGFWGFEDKANVKLNEAYLARNLNLLLSHNPLLHHITLIRGPACLSQRDIRAQGTPALPTTTGIFCNVRLQKLHTLTLGWFEVDWAELAALAQGSNCCMLQKLHLRKCGGDVTDDLHSWMERAQESFGNHICCCSD